MFTGYRDDNLILLLAIASCIVPTDRACSNSVPISLSFGRFNSQYFIISDSFFNECTVSHSTVFLRHRMH